MIGRTGRLGATSLAAAGLLTACQPKVERDDPRITELQQQVQALNARVVILEAVRKQALDDAHARKAAGFDLVTSWPNTAPDHHQYASRADCETARAVILMDNKREVDEANARVGEVLPGGGVVAAARSGPLPTALCIPL